ncbi:MAG: hypothetical protein JWM11_6626 [Planctomycetaceae bacterium]|nr:hypothetical protein [Planctomycetaceae bacterium]
MLRLHFNCLACCVSMVCLIGSGFTQKVSAADRPLNFARDIRPILSHTCFKCHGPDEKERKAGLRLDTQEGGHAKLESGSFAVVPGKIEASELIARIMTDDPTLKMPPPESGKKITPEQIATLKKWISEGGNWSQHWSFISPKRVDAPAIKNVAWARNEIDRFIAARLDAEGLEPSKPADKITLIRRVSFDLTGLPPTPSEVDAFLADTSAEAYEHVVDRLLQSSRYGEHMSRYWLDAARYGDTHGLHLDNERSLWPYRDWVIKAFNTNKKFNEFTVEQLAGDLLPQASLEQQVASGFNRNNVSTSEGGSINDEVLVRYAVDRVETVSTVFLGMTLGCAVCHDHKFDPVTQKEFYQLFAFYNGVADQAMDGNALSPPPVIKTSTDEQKAKLAAFDVQIAEAQKKVVDELAKVEYTEPADAANPVSTEPKEYVWFDDAPPAGAKLEGNTEWKFVTKAEGPVFSNEKASTRTATELSQHFFTGATSGLRIGEGDKLFAYVYLDPKNPPKEVMLQFNDGAWEHRAYWGENAIPWGAENSPARVAMGPLPKIGEWVRLEVEAAKVGLNPGAVLNGWAFTQHGGTCYWDKSGSVTRTPQAGLSFDSLAQWAAYEKAQSKSTLPPPVLEVAKLEADKRNDDQKKILRNYFLENVYAKTKPTFEPLKKQVADLQKQRTDFDNAIPTTLVMADMAQARETFILVRGAYNKKADKVTAGVPAIFPPVPKDAPMNRLGLAKWLVEPSHPMTARVTINRFWQQLFGAGIVKTSEDFGAQGQWPTHPELLDWLATEFIRTGWDVKGMIKLMVMSNAYQQSSQVSPQLQQRDPNNELLARGPRFRFDAEVIRDSALSVSGLLIERVGGKSVKPYQPDGLWEAVGFVGSNTSAFKQDQGEALYRRSMYTFWKRTSPPPGMTTFDAPSRENCSVRRPRTNTPLQALALMNDKQYVEASRALAQRMMLEGGATAEERLALGFRLLTARRPSAEEIAVLIPLYQAQLTIYQADKDAATKLISYGDSKRDEKLEISELAAWTMMANLMLNLDESVTKE